MASRIILFALWLMALLAAPAAEACGSAAVYRSVVLNSVPDEVLEGATVFHVRVESAYAVDGEIQGIRGTLLQQAATLAEGTQIEIATRLGSMCNTWIEIWSSNPTVSDGILSGYIVGRIVEETNGRAVIWPALYRGEDFRSGDLGTGAWLESGGPRSRPQLGYQWTPMRVDAEALANNLNETNRLIRENLEAVRDD